MALGGNRLLSDQNLTTDRAVLAFGQAACSTGRFHSSINDLSVALGIDHAATFGPVTASTICTGMTTGFGTGCGNLIITLYIVALCGNDGLLNRGGAADGADLASGQAARQTGGVLTGDHDFVMALGLNNRLSHQNSIADGAVLALGQARFGAGCLNRGIDDLGVAGICDHQGSLGDFVLCRRVGEISAALAVVVRFHAFSGAGRCDLGNRLKAVDMALDGNGNSCACGASVGIVVLHDDLAAVIADVSNQAIIGGLAAVHGACVGVGEADLHGIGACGSILNGITGNLDLTVVGLGTLGVVVAPQEDDVGVHVQQVDHGICTVNRSGSDVVQGVMGNDEDRLIGGRALQVGLQGGHVSVDEGNASTIVGADAQVEDIVVGGINRQADSLEACGVRHLGCNAAAVILVIAGGVNTLVLANQFVDDADSGVERSNGSVAGKVTAKDHVLQVGIDRFLDIGQPISQIVGLVVHIGGDADVGAGTGSNGNIGIIRLLGISPTDRQGQGRGVGTGAGAGGGEGNAGNAISQAGDLNFAGGAAGDPDAACNIGHSGIGGGDGVGLGRGAAVGQLDRQLLADRDGCALGVAIAGLGGQFHDLAAGLGAGVAGTGIIQILDGGLARGQVDDCVTILGSIGRIGAAGADALGLQQVQTIGIVALDDNGVFVNFESGHGQGVVGPTVAVADITIVQDSEVQGLGGTATLDLHGVALLQIDGAAAQVIVISTGMVVAGQEENIQSLACRSIQCAENRSGILIISAGGKQRLVGQHKDGL